MVEWTKDTVKEVDYYYIYDIEFPKEVSITRLYPDQVLAREEYRFVMPVVLPKPPNKKELPLLQ